MKTRLSLIGLTLAAGLLGLRLLLGAAAAWAPDASSAVLEGVVEGESGPLAGAHVRVRATENLTLTDAAGRFQLTGLAEGEDIEVTGWYSGYYIATAHVSPPTGALTLTLRAYHTLDNPDYEWVSPISGTSVSACGNCHPMIMPQWQNNAHGQAIANPRFYSLYTGSDLSNTETISPGYLLDFPGTAGSCANCHAPGAGVDGYLRTNMTAVRGELSAGIHCDFCHKVGGVYLNPATASVYPNVPGVQGLRMLRPPSGEQIFFGPYDDIHDPDTYLPAMEESVFCATCHQFSMWGTPIYESYNEWLASPYAEQGVTCQACHMPPNGDEYFALPEVGGLPHPPESIPSHLDLGARDETFLQTAIDMALAAELHGDELWVTVTLTNTGAGHHYPTDFPGRHLILTVAADEQGGPTLAQLAGETVPDWGGPQAGIAGKAYAKVLRDVLSGAQPVVSYWNQTLIESDNRLPALASDTSVYRFAAPAGAPAVVTAELRLRRVFWEVLETRGWDTPDLIVAAESTLVVAAE